MSLHCKENEPSQAATSAPSSFAGSDSQPPGLPPSSSTTQACNDGGSTFFVRETLPANVEVEEAPPIPIFYKPIRTCFFCGATVDPILLPCAYCNATICLEHSRSCSNAIFTQPSKRLRNTRYACDGLFCPNHELLHNCPAPAGVDKEDYYWGSDIDDDGDDPGSSDKDSFAKADTGNLPAGANS